MVCAAITFICRNVHLPLSFVFADGGTLLLTRSSKPLIFSRPILRTWPQEWRADVEVAVQRTSHTAERWHDRLGSVWVALD